MYTFLRLTYVLCAVTVFTDAQQTKSNSYKGCYEYSSKNSLVSDFHSNDIATLTPLKCIETCAKQKFPFAGLEKDGCHCGHHMPSDQLKRSRSECNIPCPGDNKNQCGGISKVSLYETGIAIKEIIPSRIYLGCFRDDVPEFRIMKESVTLDDNSYEKCHKHCFYSGWRYFGLTYIKECWCGDAAPSADRLKGDSACDTPCSGNSKEFCGGSWRMTMFATGIPNYAETGRVVGCYRNPQNEIKVTYSTELSTTNTNRRCLNVCHVRGFKYSAVQNKTACTCTDTIPNIFLKDDDYSCNQQECPGDSGDKCVIKGRIRLYRTRNGDSNIDVEPKSLGCYQDQEDFRVFDDEKIQSFEKLTSSLCIDICKNRGYEFAGVESGNECYCSHTYPSRYVRVGEFECNTPCSGNANSNCGGLFRIYVYSTGIPRSQASVNKWYLGCFRDDDKNNRMLRGQWSEFKDNSPQICHRHCLNIGYLYFGTTNIKECFCGDEDPWADLKVSEFECSKECAGDANQNCGGNWRLSAYRTGIYDIPQNESTDLGCFKNDGDLLTDRKIELSWSNLPTRCTNICDLLGYLYAGVERGIECKCGNRKPKGKPVDNSQCAHKCPGFSGNTCGGTKHIKVRKTTLTEQQAMTRNPDPSIKQGSCKPSDSTLNGEITCKNLSLLNEDFRIINSTIWTPTIKMAWDPDYEFVSYSSAEDVIYVRDSVLFIKPKVQSSDFVQGSLKVENCTGKPNTQECSKTAQSSNILPPVKSAQITTKNSVSFRFGRMEIRAKLPVGDWIVPEIWLSSQGAGYGPDYQSGQIRIAMIRGNKDLKCGSQNLGNQYLQAGVYLGPRNGVKHILFTKHVSEEWLSKFHDFSIVWSPDNISFFVDGELLSNILKNPTDTVRSVAQIPSNVEYLWRDGSRLAPFDREFYLTLGVSVGGLSDFPDSCTSNDVKKPWANTSPKAMWNFWKKSNQWSSTWKDENSALQIEHIKLNAL